MDEALFAYCLLPPTHCPQLVLSFERSGKVVVVLTLQDAMYWLRY